MKMIQNCGRGIAFILLSFWGILFIPSAKAMPELKYGGDIKASHSKHLPVRGSLSVGLDTVDTVVFRTTFKRHSSSTRTMVVGCFPDLKEVLQSGYLPTLNLTPTLRIYDANNKEIAWLGQNKSNTLQISSGNVGEIVNFVGSHRMFLSPQVRIPFKRYAPDAVFECAAYQSGHGTADNIISMTYYRLIVTGLHSAAVPSISALKSLHLGDCLARSSEVLRGTIPITLSNEGEHEGLTGTLTAQVTQSRGNPHDLSIKTRVAGQEHNLTQGITIPSDGGSYLLDVTTPCPSTGGDYMWSATLTYTIQ